MNARDASSRLIGLAWLGLAAISVGIHIWLARGLLFPIAREAEIEYVVISASIAMLVLCVVAASVAIFIGHLVVRHAAARVGPQPPFLALDDVAYARPLVCLVASALGLLNVVPGVGPVLSVWSYLIVDLRWWWVLAVIAWVVVGLDRRIKGTLRANVERAFAAPNVRRWLPEVTLFAIAITWAVAGTPYLRFSGVTDGDEPKYVRFCETLYQGLGFEVTNLRPIADLPARFRPRLWRNVASAAEILPGELRSLVSDSAAFLAEPSRHFNRARSVDAGFVIGKNGGWYQLYNPGVSILMLPAYYVDRRFGRVEPGSRAQWPTDLRAVNAFFLGLYAVLTLLIFRFLRHLGGSPWVAWIATLCLTLTLPVAAFPFQFYPELAGGVLLFGVARHLLFVERAAPISSFFHGALVGYLPWLHVRFSAVAAVLAVGAAVLLHRDAKRVGWFLAGAAVPALCLCLYAYRVTGSILPTAMWSGEGSEPVFSASGALRTAVAYLLDRDWGLFAHSPVMLFAIPGYWWLARRRPDVAALNLLAFLALLIPAAGHTLHGAGTTPMRLIVAVVPFAAAPLAEALSRHGHRRLFQVVFGLLLVLSLDNALSYNLHHYKGFGPMVDWSLSAWKVNLLFPSESRTPWQVSVANGVLFVAWTVVVILLVMASIGWSRPQRRMSTRLLQDASAPRITLMAIFVFALLGSAVAAGGGGWYKTTYRVPPRAAAERAALQLDRLDGCAVCLSSMDGRLTSRDVASKLEDIAPAVVIRR